MASQKLAITANAATELKLPKATAKQLADFAEQVLGLEGVDYRLGGDKILEKMRTAQYDKDFIEVEGPEPDIQRIDPPRPVNARRMATIRIQNQETPGGSDPVPVAVNGKQMFIPRDRDCTVPWEYAHALDNAKKLIYETDEIGRLKPEPKEAHEYPFSWVRQDPDPEQQAA